MKKQLDAVQLSFLPAAPSSKLLYHAVIVGRLAKVEEVPAEVI